MAFVVCLLPLNFLKRALVTVSDGCYVCLSMYFLLILFIYNLLFSLLMLMLSTIVVSKPVCYYVFRAHSYILRKVFISYLFIFLLTYLGFVIMQHQLIGCCNAGLDWFAIVVVYLLIQIHIYSIFGNTFKIFSYFNIYYTCKFKCKSLFFL